MTIHVVQFLGYIINNNQSTDPNVISGDLNIVLLNTPM